MLRKFKKRWEEELPEIGMMMASIARLYGEDHRFDFID